MNRTQLLFTLLTAGIAFSGCEEVTPEPPVTVDEVKEIDFQFTHSVNGEELVFDTKYFDLPDGSTVNSTRISYIMSKFYLVDENDQKVTFNDQYALLMPKLGYNNFILKDVPKGNYKAIGFTLGLDSAVNHGDPSQYPVTHPLSPSNNSLFWNWAGGYVFLALEGFFEGTNDSYIFHIAGSNNKVEYEFPLNFVKSEAAMQADVEFKLEECFQNPSVYDMDVDGKSTHNIDDAVTKKIVANLSTLFTINGIHE